MQINIPKETKKKVEAASKTLGFREDEIINRAVLLYLDNIEKYLELKKELKEWDELSEDALTNFEKNL